MSPRKAAALRHGDGSDLHEHLIATAARIIGQRGTAGLAVRDIAREAQVADGVLYNYFEDKDDLLAQALLAHVGLVMANSAPAPEAGSGSVAGNLQAFIENGFATLSRVAPAFAGVISQPGVLARFHAMVGGDQAFGASPGDDGRKAGAPQDDRPPGRGRSAGSSAQQAGAQADQDPGAARGLPAILRAYLAAEQQLGRVDQGADIEAAVAMIVGVIHGEVLPRVVFSLPGSLVSPGPGLAGRAAETILAGIGPRDPG